MKKLRIVEQNFFDLGRRLNKYLDNGRAQDPPEGSEGLLFENERAIWQKIKNRHIISIFRHDVSAFMLY